MSLTLNDIEAGRQAVIVKIGGGGAIRQRLLDMGVTRGAKVKVERHAPLGDPVEISVRGYYLALRRAEAASILVEEAPDA